MIVPVADVIGELRAAATDLRERPDLAYAVSPIADALADALDGLLGEHQPNGGTCSACVDWADNPAEFPCPTLRLLLPVVRTTLGTETS